MTTSTAQVFRLPDLGEGLTEAGLVQWLVQVGDEITTDQAIAEVETAKSVVELPSPFAGVVTALHGEPGDTINVGSPVLEVASADTTEKDAYRSEERAGSGNVLIGYGTSERSGSGRRRMRRNGPATSGVAGPVEAPHTPWVAEPVEAPHTPWVAEPVEAPHTPWVAEPVEASQGPSTSSGTQPGKSPAGAGAHEGPVAVRSPLVRRLARDLGVDVRTITGTGSAGAITRGDVLRAAVDHAVDGVAAPGASDPGNDVDGLVVTGRERLSPMRKAISAKLSRSRSEIPEATVWVDVDATRLWQLRAEMAPAGGTAPSLTALIARFTVLALADYPLLASRLNDDATEITTLDGVNLGVAADTERGLMVPVLPRAHELSLNELDGQLRELAATAREGRMPPERLRGSTFTLNNYGSLGVDGSAAIINHPEVAILGIGRMIERPWVVDGHILPRRIAQLSLVFDHRVCDGGYAAGFLRRVTELIEHPLRVYGSL